MKKLIVYFHGYGSSEKSDKVVRLKTESEFEVHSFSANIDPIIAIDEVGNKIDLVLADNHHEPVKLIFIGTSLGGWLASKMASRYDCDAIIINPSVDPANSLAKYDVPEDIRSKYDVLVPNKKHKYFFAENDLVINNTEFRKHLTLLGHDVIVIKDADHRFGDDAFEKVISYVKNIVV
jgi:predicted esterase YcpF (UPF0227 family)